MIDSILVKDWNKMLENEWLGNQGEEGNSKYALSG
jgi:hypothetical protein